MTSREALKLAILEYEKDLEFDKNNQWVKDVLKGLKECQQDIEVLEIIKKVFNYKSVQKFVENMTQDDFFKVKEWLENDSN